MKKTLIAALAALATLGAVASTPQKGDLLGEAGIGVGAISGPGSSRGAFTQRIAVEKAIEEFEFLNADWTLTAGFQVNNGVSTGSSEIITPLYSYKTNFTYDDLTLMPMASIHHGFTDNLDGYATLGLGLGLLNYKSSGNLAYKYTEASFAMSFNLGARYWLSANLAVNAQFGLVSAAWKNSYGSYNILSAGVTYKF